MHLCTLQSFQITNFIADFRVKFLMNLKILKILLKSFSFWFKSIKQIRKNFKN